MYIFYKFKTISLFMELYYYLWNISLFMEKPCRHIVLVMMIRIISRTHVLDKIKLTLLSIADYDDN